MTYIISHLYALSRLNCTYCIFNMQILLLSNCTEITNADKRREGFSQSTQFYIQRLRTHVFVCIFRSFLNDALQLFRTTVKIASTDTRIHFWRPRFEIHSAEQNIYQLFYLFNFYCRKFLQKLNHSLDVQSTIFYNYHFLLRFTCLNSVCNTKSNIDKTLAETIKIPPHLWWGIIALLSFICLLYDAINALNIMLYPPPILNKLSGLMMMSTFPMVSDNSIR